MVQSVELTLDAASDAAVRVQWQALADAGLPSQARHRGASNRPHVTLAAQPVLDDAQAGPGLAAACAAALPLALRLGAPVLFGAGPYVLVRLVVAASELLALHAEVARLVGAPPGTLVSPGRWTPHVTLARRIAGADLPAALALLPAEELDVVAVTARRWDGDAKREWTLASCRSHPAGPGRQ